MIDKVLKDMSSSFRSKRIQIESKVSGTVRAIAWPIIVQEALHNLLENAVKFSQEGGSIAVSAQFNGNECLVEVTDRGIGIPRNMQDAIFFANSPAGREGTKGESSSGNGLYLSRNLMRSINGDIAVARSEEGKGTTMRLTIPG